MTNKDGKPVHQDSSQETLKGQSHKVDGKATMPRPPETELPATRDLDYSAHLSEYERESLAAEAKLKAYSKKKRTKSPPKA
jgi:hypothetical protein